MLEKRGGETDHERRMHKFAHKWKVVSMNCEL
jgi:hypothetical protein